VDDRLVVPLIRARPDTLYCGRYRWEDGQMRPLDPPAMQSLPELVARLSADPAARYLFCGEALIQRGESLRAACRAAGVSFSEGHADPPRAALLAALAESRFASGQTDDPLSLVPLYIAPPQADPRAERFSVSQFSVTSSKKLHQTP
jgi:tRNA A37 threonylcarbamoyladenosine modification protein TsaB